MSRKIWPLLSVVLAILLTREVLNRPDECENPNDHQSIATGHTSTNSGAGVVFSRSSLASSSSIVISRMCATDCGSARTIPPSPQQPDAHPTKQDREYELQQMMYTHQLLLAAHNSELRNAAWSESMEAKVKTSFQSLPADVKAKPGEIDCRSTTCTVLFSWPSREAAEGEAAVPINMATSGVPCRPSIVYPQDYSGYGDYQATLYLDCSEHITPPGDKLSK